MKISELLKEECAAISFEVFPPKTSEKFAAVFEKAEEIAALSPRFLSVTYGAAGGSSAFTVELGAKLQRESGVPVLAHLTCVGADKTDVKMRVAEYKAAGIENILALRGDPPEGGRAKEDYRYAAELVADLKAQGDFCVGGACYPEGHIECPHKADDLRHLKEKVDAGCDFLTTQMFFDNHIFYNFLYRVREIGISVPVLPGIMPITSPRQLDRSVALSGTNVPERFRAIVDHFGEDPRMMEQAGIIYASEQIVDLIANGIRHIHVYSMNKPQVARGILSNLSYILGGGA